MVTNSVVAERFLLERKVGEGAFGDVYFARDQKQKGLEVAIKIDRENKDSLIYEAHVHRKLGSADGVPRLLHVHKDGSQSVLAMERLGPSLEQMHVLCHRKFSLKTVLMLGQRLVSLLEYLHQRGYVHRDIKPQNFLLGLGSKAHVIHVIDFGVALKYRSRVGIRKHQHIPYSENQRRVGSLRYASVYTHQGIGQSRRTDLESVGYLLVYFSLGSLPWQKVEEPDAHARDKLLEKMKRDRALFKELPREVEEYVQCCRKLSYEETPNYEYLRQLFRTAMDSRGLVDDDVFDWSIIDTSRAAGSRLSEGF
eukprot:Rmarinus@m.15788